MTGVSKCIKGQGGETRVGPLAIPFIVEGNSLHYRRCLRSFVDELSEPDGDRVQGRSTFRGIQFGRFELRRIE
jgi:hypothetical protein